MAPKDPEQKIKVAETGAVRLSEQVTVATRLVRFLVADWSLTNSLKGQHRTLKRTSSSSNQKSSLTRSLTVRLSELNPEKL